MTLGASTSVGSLPAPTPDAASGATSGESARSGHGSAADVRTVVVWTLVSRISGFARVAVIAAVLGPTFFGNLFLTTLAIPAAILELFLGTMIAMLLVPALVRRIDVGEIAAARRLANGLLGMLVLLTAVLVGLALFLGGQILDVITAAVADPEIREQQRQLGWPLLLVLMPQIVLHAVVAVAIAVQNANGRFALPAAAPAIENIGIVSVLLVSAWLFGVGTELEAVTAGQLMLLALGSTAAVALHAAVQWWGARAVGFALLPTTAWRDPDIRHIFRLAAPSSGNTALATGTWLGLLVAAGSVPGGAVALQIGYSLFNLPIALGARPVATAQLPRLSRHALDHDGAAFGSLYGDSLAMARFVVLPASLVFILMPETLAHAVAFGRMADPAGIALVTAAILGLGVGLLGEAVMVVGTAAAYARHDATTPMQAMAIRAAAMAAGITVALGVMAEAVQLLTLCLALSVGNLAAAAYLHGRLLRPAAGRLATGASAPMADLLTAAVAVLPVALLARHLGSGIDSQQGHFLMAAMTLGCAAIIYLGLQYWRGAAALTALLGFPRRRLRGAPAAEESSC